MEKQFMMMETILYLYEKCRALVNRGMPVSVLKEDKFLNVSFPSNTRFQIKSWSVLMNITKISTVSTINVLERNG